MNDPLPPAAARAADDLAPATAAPTVPASAQTDSRAGAASTAELSAPAALPPAPSPRQLGRFSITRALRREKNSVVYLAADPVLHRDVIIKAVQLPPPADATAHADAQIDPLEQAFVRQAQAAGKLSHPHIVTVYEAGRVHETGYLAIERVNGRPLHELIASGWRPQFVHCASIAARIADAIEHAHLQGVAHGHLGPQHVVLQLDGVPKVEGFGGWIDSGSGGDEALARTEKLLPYFHSELTDEERRRDVRAVAALVFMMVTGKAPGDKPAPVTSLRPEAPAPLARLVDQMLAPGTTPAARRTAADLRDALTSFIWNERRENIAPATIGIPLAAPPRRAEAAHPSRPVAQAESDAPTVSIDLDPPALQVPPATAPVRLHDSRADGRPGTRPATLTLRPATEPVEPLASELPLAPDAVSTPAQRMAAFWQALPGWLRANRAIVGGLAGLVITGAVIAVILAAASGPNGNAARPPAAQTPAAAPAATGSGVIKLDIAPWGEVFVNGKPIGVSPPLDELKLPAGRHSVEIRYGDKAAVTAQVEVDPAKPLQIRHRFD
jgi:serine/threonine-protein kinase